MKGLLAIAAVASTLLAGGMSGAVAFPLQAIDPVSGAFSGSSPTGGSLGTPLPGDLFPVFADSDTDFFGFYIPFQGTYTISANVAADVSNNVIISSFLLYNSAGLVPSDPVPTAMYRELITGKYFALDRITLDRGLYYLGVVATGVNAQPPSGYSGTLSKGLSPVPLPASAPMFGAAVLALGAVGYGLKRKKTATTV